MSNKILIGMVVFSLILIFSSLYVISKLDPGKKPKALVSKAINMQPYNVVVSNDFMLQTENGDKFTYNNLLGKYTLIYFGFSYCPDICPLTMQNLEQVYDLINKNMLNKVQFIFVSVDPDRDDLNTLKKFTEAFSNKILGVTGEKSEIDKLANSLKVYYSAKMDEDKTNKNYYVDHSSFIYLLDHQGKLLYQFAHEVTPQEIVQELNNIVK